MRVKRDGDRAYASILQEPAQFGEEVDPVAILAAVGLVPEDAHPTLRPQLVSTGLATLVAPVASADAVRRARSDAAAVKALADGTFNLYLCAIDGEVARARSFMSELAGEDPATGSAAGPLMAYANVRPAPGASRSPRAPRSAPEPAAGRDRGRPPEGGGDVVVLVTGTLRLPGGAPRLR